MSDYSNAIEINGLKKVYDGFKLENVSFQVPRGCIMGFVGQNGAGKTTVIRSILNIIPINGGEINVFGMNHIKNEQQIKKRTAVVFDEFPFHDIFTANDVAKIFRGIYPEWDNNIYHSYLERFQLPLKKKTASFSKGMKMKLQIACAVSHNAELLILDEPTAGLDPIVRDDILNIFMEYLRDENRSILMSSHITSDLEKIADSITFINRGQILLSGSKDEMLENYGIIKCSRDDIRNVEPSDIISIRANDFGVEAMVGNREKMREKYKGLIIDPTSLEEIMLYYVNKDKKEWIR